MCYALYHLSDKEIDLLKEKILPNCDLVIIQNREQPRKTKHNKYKFYKSKKVVKFFQDQGYDVEIIWGEDRGTKKAFSEIICRKGGEARVEWTPGDLEKLDEFEREEEAYLAKKMKNEKREPVPFNMIGPVKNKGVVEDLKEIQRRAPLVAKKKSVKKKVSKKVVKKVANQGQNKTDKAGETPVSERRNPPQG